MPVRVVSDTPVKTKRVTCPTCSYELEFTGEDVHVSVDSDGDVFMTIRCPRPSCNEHNKDLGGAAISVKWP